jgi:hypothetical protein
VTALVFETTLPAGLFAVLFDDLLDAACFGFAADFVTTAFLTALLGLLAARAGATLAAFALVAEVLTGFLVAFAIGPSTKWGCQCLGNWSASRCCHFSDRAGRLHIGNPGDSAVNFWLAYPARSLHKNL